MKLILILFTAICFGQVSSKKDTIQNKYVYVNVIQTYERIVAKGYNSPDLYQKIGDYYYNKRDYKRAITWYYRLVQLTSKIDYQVYTRYSNALCEVNEWFLSDYILIKAQKELLNKNDKTVK